MPRRRTYRKRHKRLVTKEWLQQRKMKGGAPFPPSPSRTSTNGRMSQKVKKERSNRVTVSEQTNSRRETGNTSRRGSQAENKRSNIPTIAEHNSQRKSQERKRSNSMKASKQTDYLMYTETLEHTYLRRFHVFRVLNLKIANVHFKWLDDPKLDLVCLSKKTADIDTSRLASAEYTISRIKENIEKLFNSTNTDIVIGDFNYSAKVLQKIFNENKFNPKQIGQSMTDKKTLKQQLMELKKLKKLNIMQKQVLENLQESEQVDVSNESQQTHQEKQDDCYCITNETNLTKDSVTQDEVVDKKYTSSPSNIKTVYKNSGDFPIFDHQPVILSVTLDPSVTLNPSVTQIELITINVGATFPTWHKEIIENKDFTHVRQFSEWHSRRVIKFLKENVIQKKTNYVVCLQEVDMYMYTQFKEQLERHLFHIKVDGLNISVSDFHMNFKYIAMKDTLKQNIPYLSYGLFSFSDLEIDESFSVLNLP